MPVASPRMLDRLPPDVTRLLDEHGVKALRYCGVSAFNVLFGLATLAFFHGVLHWAPVVANISSWVVGTVPAYLLSRRWVWQQSGEHSFGREVLPFWLLALVGLAFSTTIVGIVGTYTDRTIFILAGSLVAYGVVWVAKYVILDKVMWRATHPVQVEPSEVV